jgi:hypothetical protein
MLCLLLQLGIMKKIINYIFQAFADAGRAPQPVNLRIGFETQPLTCSCLAFLPSSW